MENTRFKNPKTLQKQEVKRILDGLIEKGTIQRMVNGCVKSTIDNHGELTKEKSLSFSKRFTSNLCGEIVTRLKREGIISVLYSGKGDNNKMDIFILEDDPVRSKLIYEILKHDIEYRGVTCHTLLARSSDEAERILSRTKKWDLLLLDHDLIPQFMDETESNTGSTVAQYIIDNNIQYPKAIIHSINSHGANNMCRILPNSVFRSIAYLRDWRREVIDFTIQWKVDNPVKNPFGGRCNE